MTVLAVAAGALIVAFVALPEWGDPPGLPDGAPGGLDGEEVAVGVGVGEPGEVGGPVVTVAVELRPGWTVPDIHTDGQPVDDLAGLGVGVGGMAPGSETRGVSAEIRPDSSTFVLRAPSLRHLAVRLGADGRWGPWQVVGIGLDEAPDGLEGEEGAGGGPPATTPLLVPAGASTIELVDLAGTGGGVDIVFLPSFAGPSGPPPDGPAAPAIGGDGAPTILPRSAWTAAGWASGNGSCSGGPQEADNLQAVVVHHTVTTNDYQPDQVDDLLRAIHYSHTEINGWCDIGYNFVVDRFGRVWEARTGSIERSVIGGHARGFNTGTLGVALLGQHQAGASPAARTVPAAAQDAVEELANWKLGAEGVDPNGRTWLRNRSSASRQRLAGKTWHHVPTVLGHRDLGLTSCPGSHGMDLVAALPDRLAARRDVSLPYSWSGWRANDNGPGLAVLDARGGVRPAGTATPWAPAPADLGGQGAVAIGGDLAGGYLLIASGELVPYGAAPPTGSPVPAGGSVDLVMRSDGRSGWVLDGTGVLRGFAGAPDITAGSTPDPRAADLADDGRGYVLDASGRLVPVGGLGPAQVALGGAAAVDVTLDGPASGWVLAGDGRLLGFGGAGDHRVRPAAEPVAVVSAPTEPGGWVLDRHGQLWPFGGARYVFPVVTDARAADAVDLVLGGVDYRPEFLASPDARYLDGLHRLFLGRAASNAEIDRGVTGLEQGSDRIDLTSDLARSDHWAGASLDQMYLDVLGRPADPEGRSYWMGEIGRGLKLQDLGTYFYGSDEYARAAGSDEAYVRGLYQVLLRRPADDEGLRYWVGELASGRARPPDIAAGFYSSIESRRERAGRLHQQVLGSAPSSARRDALADRLPVVGDVGLAAELAAGADFYRLVANDGP